MTYGCKGATRAYRRATIVACMCFHLSVCAHVAPALSNSDLFLCSDQASFLTGGYYLVDGGYTAQ